MKLDLTERLTKRQILSDSAKGFDPFGWLSPFILQLKQLMQEVWKAKGLTGMLIFFLRYRTFIANEGQI